MKKTAILLLLMMLFMQVSHGQIVIDSTNYIVHKIDTQEFIEAHSVPVPEVGTDKVWDFGNLTPIDTFLRKFQAVSTTASGAFKNALRFEEQSIMFNQYSIKYRMFEGVDKFGHYEMGYETQAASYSLKQMSGNPSDSVIFPKSSNIFKTKSYIMKFPGSFNANWSAQTRNCENFVLTVFPFYTKSPGSVVHNVNRYDSIVGWGKLSIPTSSGKPSIYIDALLKKRTTINIDSFYLNNKPMTPTELGILKLKQMDSTIIEEYYFYTINQDQPVLIILKSDDLDGHVDRKVYYEINEKLLVSVDELPENFSAKIYPNPLTTDKLTIELEKSKNEKWTVSIYSISGKIVEKQNIDGKGAIKKEIYIKDNVKNGTYLYVLKDENNKILKTERFVLCR